MKRALATNCALAFHPDSPCFCFECCRRTASAAAAAAAAVVAAESGHCPFVCVDFWGERERGKRLQRPCFPIELVGVADFGDLASQRRGRDG